VLGIWLESDVIRNLVAAKEAEDSSGDWWKGWLCKARLWSFDGQVALRSAEYND
jgi:hypothetical protein